MICADGDSKGNPGDADALLDGAHENFPLRRYDRVIVRVALLSDIHANLEALVACLDHARAQRADDYAFLGDYVGYGADAVGVMDIVMRYVDAGALALKGNHDAAVATVASYFNDDARAALEHARNALDDRHKRFIAALPLLQAREAVTYVHASAARPERWDYVDSPSAAVRCTQAAGTSYTFCGHVHDQRLYFGIGAGRMSAFTPVPGIAVPMRGSRPWLAIVGSVGQPRDRNPSAAYATFDDVRREIAFHRVPYDYAAAAAKIRRAGLPESLAYRVEAGI